MKNESRINNITSKFYMLTALYQHHIEATIESMLTMKSSYAKYVMDEFINATRLPCDFDTGKATAKHIVWWYIHIEIDRNSVTGIDKNGILY